MPDDKVVEKSKDGKFFDTMFGRVNNWGKAVIFIFGAIFFSITFYYQVDSNTTQIDYNFKYQEKQIQILEDRLDKKHNRQQLDIINLQKELARIEKEIQKEKLENAKHHAYEKGKEDGKKQNN